MTTPANGAVRTAHEATIQTTTVEIQALKVGKKQVTMGMFRQLPYGQYMRWDIFGAYGGLHLEEESMFAGEIWGHVNYWWPEAGKDDKVYTDEWGRWLPHGVKRHIVWQARNTLYRGIVCERLPAWVQEQFGDGIARPSELARAWGNIWPIILCYPQLYIAV